MFHDVSKLYKNFVLYREGKAYEAEQSDLDIAQYFGKKMEKIESDVT